MLKGLKFVAFCVVSIILIAIALAFLTGCARPRDDGMGNTRILSQCVGVILADGTCERIGEEK